MDRMRAWGYGAAQEVTVQHVRQLLVVDIGALSHQEGRVLEALHSLPDIPGGHGSLPAFISSWL